MIQIWWGHTCSAGLPSTRESKLLRQKVQWSAPKMVKGLEHLCPVSKDWESWDCFPPETSLLQGDLISAHQYLKGGCKKYSSVQWRPVTQLGAVGTNQNRKFHLSIRKCFLLHPHFHWYKLPREVMESPCFRDTENLFGHGLGQSALAGPAWAGTLDQVTSEISSNLNYSVIEGPHL